MRTRIPVIDGLRAVACLAVLARHASIPAGSGGWLGVDVFFVLSGYLISGLLLEEIDRTGRIRLAEFYLRRAARLYPALLLTVAGCAVLTALGFAGRFPLTPQVAMVAVTYQVDFLASVGRNAGLLNHVWSLSVEEQFYLLWPPIVLAVRTRRRVAAVAVVAAVLSFVAMLVPVGLSGGIDNIALYYAPHARAWELLLGCALAACAPRLRRAVPASALAGGVRAAGIVGVVVMLSAPLTPIHSAWQCLAVTLATALILLGADGDSWPIRILSCRPMTWFGERTYGVYLYHYPIFAVLGLSSTSRYGTVAVALGVTLVIAAASYRWVETPVREAVRERRQSRSSVRKALNA